MSTMTEVSRQVDFLAGYLRLLSAYEDRDADAIARIVRELAREYPEWAAGVCTTASGAVQALMRGDVEPAQMRRWGRLVRILQAMAAKAVGGDES